MNTMKFLKDKQANVGMIAGVVGLLVTIIVSVLVFYNIAGGIDAATIDADIGDVITGAGTGEGSSAQNVTPADNATGNILDQAETFYQIAPIIAIVTVAVIILMYVGRIG